MYHLAIAVVIYGLVNGVFARDRTTPNPAELFSFDKLAEYSSLASCFAQIHEEFAYCNEQAEKKGRPYLEGVDPASEWARRIKCCGAWKLRDCWVNAARQKCNPMQAEQVHNLPYKFMPQIEDVCVDYPPGSEKCAFPVWIIVLVVIVAFLLITCGIWCGMRLFRRRRNRQMVKPIDVKPTPV